MPEDSPERIGRYEILQELGRGSMGRVYLARDPNIDRRVAIKVLAPLDAAHSEEEAELRRRFILEARAAGKVNHTGIVTVHDAERDPDSGRSFIVMEWVEGESLEQRLVTGALSATEVARLGEELALALDAAHRAGLVHRDIKPANILLDQAGRAKISDFGIAKFASMSNTAAGRLVGSPFYMSPEQVRNEPVDGRSDLFSLGSVLYQAATGAVPFGSDSLAGITYKILEIDPPPTSVLEHVPPELGAVIDKALSKDPKDRFQSGRELAQALRAVDLDRDLDTPTPTGTLILPQDEIGGGTTRNRSWINRHRGLLLAVLTLLAAPLLLRLSFPGPDEPAPDWGSEDSSAEIARPTADTAPGVPLPTANLAIEPAVGQAVVSPQPRSTGPVGPAIVEVRYRNHLRSGRMTIRVDDVVAWAGEVGKDKGVVGRAVGNDIRTLIEVPAGKHVIGIEIQGADGTVDATKRIWTVFEAGSRERLKVRLLPPRVIRLSWED